MTYRIVRKYFGKHEDRVLVEGLTLEEAQEHCSDPDTSSRSCWSEEAVEHTAQFGPWFDCYYAEDD
jgi:hypothetical protein